MVYRNQIIKKIPLLVLAGPTAVGKTALAINIARALNTEIISADSAQIYRYQDIGTAKPTQSEQKAAKHHLIDLVNPDQNFSVADYQKAAFKIIDIIWYKGKLPFLVGGTGLYIKAVTDRYAFGPRGASSDIRAGYERVAASGGLDKLYAELERVDPDTAKRIHPHDQRRIIRALEVFRLEGRPISEQVAETKKRESPYQVIFFGLHIERTALYRKIEERVDKMIELGFVDEVRDLIRRGYSASAPGMQILGYRQLLSYLQGEKKIDAAVAEIKKQTRNLAKRQLTWFRRENKVHWLEISKERPGNAYIENICRKVQDLAQLRANS